MKIALFSPSIIKWIIPPQHSKHNKRKKPGICNLSNNNIKNYLKSNKSFAFYVTSFIALNVICFSVRAYAYRKVSLVFSIRIH